jgi:hydrogenase maturation protease
MIDVLVLGIGNPLLGDDGFGVEVIRRLREQKRPPLVEFLDGGTAGLALLPNLEGRSHVLVADAIDFGGRPGQVVRLRSADIPYYRGLKLSEHQVTFHEVLALMDLMEIRPREMLFLGVQPRSTHWGDPLSGEVEAAIPGVMEEIGRQLARWESVDMPNDRDPAS